MNANIAWFPDYAFQYLPIFRLEMRAQRRTTGGSVTHSRQCTSNLFRSLRSGSSGEFVGELTGLASPLAEELVKLSAGGIRGAPMLLGGGAREQGPPCSSMGSTRIRSIVFLFTVSTEFPSRHRR
jgi:hypothetical protein